jgi:hydrogenase/urease accessory protein HupE
MGDCKEQGATALLILVAFVLCVTTGIIRRFSGFSLPGPGASSLALTGFSFLVAYLCWFHPRSGLLSEATIIAVAGIWAGLYGHRKSRELAMNLELSRERRELRKSKLA